MTIAQARKILGKSSEKFSDSEIESLINQFTSIAEVVCSIIGSKNLTMGIEASPKKEDYENW